MAKKWESVTPKNKKLPKKLSKQAYWQGFYEKLAEDRSKDEYSTNPFGPEPDLLPSLNVHTYMKTMREIYDDPTLSPPEKSRLIAKLEDRPKIPEPGTSTAGMLLGAGMGAGAAHLLTRYLLSSKDTKHRYSPIVRKLISLGALGFGGYLGAQEGRGAFSREPHILDLRRDPSEEMYSPWKIM